MGFADSDPGTGVAPSAFITDDGDIRWARLSATIAGAGWLAAFTGIIQVIITTAQEVAGIYTAVGVFLADLITVLLGAPTSVITTSFDELQAFVTTLGPLSYLGAVVSVLLIVYVSDWVVTNA